MTDTLLSLKSLPFWLSVGAIWLNGVAMGLLVSRAIRRIP
jgi:hypothetical protein